METKSLASVIANKLVEIKQINEELAVVEDSISRIDYVIATYKSYDGIHFVNDQLGEKKNDFLLPLEIQTSIAKQIQEYYTTRRSQLIAQASELIK